MDIENYSQRILLKNIKAKVMDFLPLIPLITDTIITGTSLLISDKGLLSGRHPLALY